MTVNRSDNFGEAYLGGTPGFSEPLGAIEVPLAANAAPQLLERGIRIVGEASNSVLILAEDGRAGGLEIRLHQRVGTRIVLGNCPKLIGAINVEGDDHYAAICATVHSFRINLTLRGKRGGFLMGEGCSANDVDFLVDGPGASIQVGDDAQISYGVTVRTSDSHGIIDISRRRQINFPLPVVIGPHVWLGARSTVTKGNRVGRGSIIGENSIVTRNVPDIVAVAGAPAEIKRVGVTWTRASRPSEFEMDEAIKTVLP